MKFKRRELLRNIAKAGLLLPFSHQVLFQGQVAAATGNNIVFFYYPNGCVTSDMSSGGFQTQGLRAAGTPFKVHNKYLNGVSGGAHEGGRFVLRAGQGDTTADHLIADRLGTSVLNLGLRAESLQDKFVTSWKYGAAQTNMSNPTDVANYLQSQSGGTIEPGDNGQNILLETLTQDFEELRALAIQAGKNDGLTSKLDLHVAALEALQPTAEGAREFVAKACQYVSFDDPGYRDNGGGEEGGLAFHGAAKAQLDNIAAAISCGNTRVVSLQIGYGDENPSMLNFGYVEECWKYMQQAGVPESQRYWTESTNHSASHKAQNQHKSMNAYLFELMAYLHTQLKAVGVDSNTTILAYSDVGDGSNHGPENGGIIEVGNANLGGNDFKDMLNSAANWMGVGSIL